MAEVSKPDFETGEPRSILSMHLHAKGIRKYQLTPVAWAGGVIPVQSDKYKHLDGSIDDFRQRAVLYSEAPETVIDAPLEYREMIIRSMAIFRYSPNKATMVRLSDGRVLHQNNSSNAFYGLLAEKPDLNFFQDFLFQGDRHLIDGTCLPKLLLLLLFVQSSKSFLSPGAGVSGRRSGPKLAGGRLAQGSSTSQMCGK